MAEAKVTIDVANVPEVVHACIKRLVDVLRHEAGKEVNPAVAKRLRSIAAKFEAGQ